MSQMPTDHTSFIRISSKPDGVSYIASKDPERAEKEFCGEHRPVVFGPIHQRVGPDGAM